MYVYTVHNEFDTVGRSPSSDGMISCCSSSPKLNSSGRQA